MDLSALLVLHRYNDYANRLVLEAATQLNQEDLTRPCSPSHGSVIGLLQHMLGTEVYFLLECKGLPPAPDTDEISSLNQMKELYSRISDLRGEYLRKASEEELQESISVKSDREWWCCRGGNIWPSRCWHPSTTAASFRS